jgi:hypothetical protein
MTEDVERVGDLPSPEEEVEVCLGEGESSTTNIELELELRMGLYVNGGSVMITWLELETGL